MPSLSKSSCPELGRRGQLSCEQRQHSYRNTPGDPSFRGGKQVKPWGQGAEERDLTALPGHLLPFEAALDTSHHSYGVGTKELCPQPRTP